MNPTWIADAYTTYDSDEPYIRWLQYLLALPDNALPSVVSTSYDDDEQTIPLSYASRACGMFAELGARGVTLLFASGDSGVGPTGYCYSNNGTNATTFLPEFPSTCPYVTSVGATMHHSPEGTIEPLTTKHTPSAYHAYQTPISSLPHSSPLTTHPSRRLRPPLLLRLHLRRRLLQLLPPPRLPRRLRARLPQQIRRQRARRPLQPRRPRGPGSGRAGLEFHHLLERHLDPGQRDQRGDACYGWHIGAGQ